MTKKTKVFPFHAGLFLKALHLYDTPLIPIKRNPINKMIILSKNKLFVTTSSNPMSFNIIPPNFHYLLFSFVNAAYVSFGKIKQPAKNITACITIIPALT
jgi:hypothetical protein